MEVVVAAAAVVVAAAAVAEPVTWSWSLARVARKP